MDFVQGMFYSIIFWGGLLSALVLLKTHRRGVVRPKVLSPSMARARLVAPWYILSSLFFAGRFMSFAFARAIDTDQSVQGFFTDDITILVSQTPWVATTLMIVALVVWDYYDMGVERE
jgi:hypothetical protein